MTIWQAEVFTMLGKVCDIITGGVMGKIIKDTIHANGIDIGIYTQDFENEFISLTDIARYKSDDPTAVIQNWMRNRDVIDFLGLWERLHNSDFNPLEFEGVRKQAGANAFTMSPKKWIEATNAIGIVSKAGRYGGTYAHSDIAMSFATWISPEFQLYIMKDYRRLKTDENSRLSLNWNLNREISKLNYRIHTDAIKDNLIPSELTPAQVAYTYANEADMLNVVSVADLAAVVTASATHKNRTLLQFFQAFFTINPVPCHILYFVFCCSFICVSPPRLL